VQTENPVAQASRLCRFKLTPFVDAAEGGGATLSSFWFSLEHDWLVPKLGLGTSPIQKI
jgi:hypothetical protein